MKKNFGEGGFLKAYLADSIDLSVAKRKEHILVFLQIEPMALSFRAFGMLTMEKILRPPRHIFFGCL